MMILNPYIFGSYTPTDADAIAFLTAAGISNPTISQAIDELVIALKAYGIWSKCVAIYPMVGGTSSTHKWNLIDPQDTDGAFRLTFSGGLTHSSDGIQFGGINGYANTHLNPYSVIGATPEGHIGFYSNSHTYQNNSVAIGAYNSGSAYTELIVNGGAGGQVYFDYPNGNRDGGASTSPYTGFFLGVNSSVDDKDLFQNGVEIVTGSYISSENHTNAEYMLGQWGNGTRFWKSNMCFATIGEALTDTECADYYTAVEAFQVLLGREA